MIKHKPLMDFTGTTFLGTVPASKLFTGQEISTAIGLTAGILHNDSTEWLHFYVGKDAICNRDTRKRPYYIWIAKQSVRYNLSWDDIKAAGAVLGKTVTDKNGKEYLCSIPTGTDTNQGILGNTNISEWNVLIYRVHNEVPVSQVGTNWENFNTLETNITDDNGSYTWCVEHYNNSSVIRGRLSLGYSHYNCSSTKFSSYGFRPVLIKYLK